MCDFSFRVAAGFEPTSFSLRSGRFNRYPILTPPLTPWRSDHSRYPFHPSQHGRPGWWPRPPLNKKWFPIHFPSGLKRADWNFFFMIFENSFFPLNFLKNEKMKKIKIFRPPDWLFFPPPDGQETIYHLRVALGGLYHVAPMISPTKAVY